MINMRNFIAFPFQILGLIFGVLGYSLAVTGEFWIWVVYKIQGREWYGLGNSDD